MSNIIEQQIITVERSIWIDAPRERVWQALTDTQQVMQWFVPNLPFGVMKRDDSGKVTVYIGEMGIDFVVLEALEEPRKITSRSVPERLLTTTYLLDEEKDGTRVTVTLSGFEGLPEDAREDRVEQCRRGWEQTLSNLKAYIEGAELPFPNAYVAPLFGIWREPRKKLAIERSIWINAPRERVWRAITDSQQITQWFSPDTPWQLSALEVGGRYYVYDAENDAEMYVEVIDVLDPPYQLVTRTTPTAPETPHVTSKILTEENGGTRLTLVDMGYELQPEDARWNNMEQNAFGYVQMLQNLKALVEGQSLPFPTGF
jgi:uncharacterized protein YndB with AHSA1/START domain